MHVKKISVISDHDTAHGAPAASSFKMSLSQLLSNLPVTAVPRCTRQCLVNKTCRWIKRCSASGSKWYRLYIAARKGNEHRFCSWTSVESWARRTPFFPFSSIGCGEPSQPQLLLMDRASLEAAALRLLFRGALGGFCGLGKREC